MRSMTKLLIGITVVAIGGIALKKVLSEAGRRRAAQSTMSSFKDLKNNTTTNTSASQEMTPMTEAQKAQARLEMKQFLTKTQNELGNDAIGVSAFVLILRQIAPDVVAQDKEIKDLCLTQNQCPFPIVDVYQAGLARLDNTQNAAAKIELQTHMLKSDIHILEKQEILARHLLATKIMTSTELSKQIGKDQVYLTKAMQYYLATSRQLQSLGVPEEKYVQIILTGLSRSRDEYAKGLIRQGLTKTFPNQQNRIVNFKAPQMNAQPARSIASTAVKPQVVSATRNVASQNSNYNKVQKSKTIKKQTNKAPQKLVKKGALTKSTRSNKIAMK